MRRDPVYKFTAIRERLASRPGPTLDFALGRRRESPPAWVPGFVAEHAALSMEMCPARVRTSLAETAAATLSGLYRVEVSAASVLPAPSGRAAMSALAATLISPGDGVLVTEPGYPAFARLAVEQHARVKVAVLDPDDGFAPRIDDPEPAKLAALNYPNNPTGALLPPPKLDALADRLDENAVIFNDAVYGPLTFSGPAFSLLTDFGLAVAGRPLIELHSLGKLFSLGPLGIAFLVGPKTWVDTVRRFADFAWSQVTTLQARVASGCLEDFSHVDGVRERIRARIHRLREVAQRLGFRPYPTAAGMYLLCRAPAEVSGERTTTAERAADLLLDRHGLAVAPWDVGPHGYLRFSSAYLDEDLEGLAALASGQQIVSG